MCKYGVVDIGSNTIRLEVYNVNENYMELFFKKKEFAGLAGYVKKGVMDEDGIQKTISVLKDYINICQLLGTKELFIFATAAIRNASNSKEIIDQVEEAINHEIDLISGEREAELGFKAVTNQFGMESGVNIDIGGGSTELTVYENGEFLVSKSFTQGALSLYTDYVSGILPTDDEVKTMRKIVQKYIADEQISDKQRKTIFGVGGTMRLLNKMMKAYYKEDNGDVIKVKKLRKIYYLLLAQDREILKMVLKISPERIHLITPGIIILMAICDHLQVKEIMVCSSGVREGYLVSKIEGE